MTQEEKAKAYDNALEKAKSFNNRWKSIQAADSELALKELKEIFPELKESENERIRKALINFFNRFPYDSIEAAGTNAKEVLAWLEKQGNNDTFDDEAYRKAYYDGYNKCNRDWIHSQGEKKASYTTIAETGDGGINALVTRELPTDVEQKPSDKVEPKFNVGDTMRTLQEANDGYTDGMPVVVSIDNEYYHCTNELIAIKDQDDYEFPPINVKQKPTDKKVEPKFNIGDWIIHNRIDSSREILYVYDIRDNRYYFNDMCHFSWSVKECDEKCHLWTIRDAKDGDVLYSIDSKQPFIYKERPQFGQAIGYCCINKFGEFAIWNTSKCLICTDKYIPATKEQRDLLFKKMRESGYEWNESKKELEKIDQKLDNKIEPKFKVGDWITNGHCTCQITFIDSRYWYSKTCVLGDIESIDKTFHPWTIVDAKDGDVLSNGKMIVIFKHFEEPSYRQHIVAYVGLDIGGDIQITDDTWRLGIDKAKPATKEQRDLLFAKMKEAGLEWNSEKKELKTIKQKLDDEIEPKFKVGDWVVDSIGVAHKIERTVLNVTNNTFGYDVVGGGYFNDDTEGVRLWTIQDAKDGDVLAAYECIVLFKEIDGLNIKCYCTYHYMGFNPSFYVDTLQNKDAFYPATKEQHNLLFSKMHEEGYEWDAEKKELKKIDEDGVEYKKHIMSELVNLATDYVKQKSEPAWSEEDEKNWQGVIDEIEANKSDAPDYDVKTYDRFLSWLKSIKQRLGGEK